MPFGLGSWFGNTGQNQTTVQKLASIDDWKNDLADSLSLGHDDGASGHLYPVAVVCKAAMGNLDGMFNNAFPDLDLMDGLRDRGITPLISWAPTGVPGDRAIATWSNWTDGDYDPGIDHFCLQYRQWCVNENAQGLNSRGEAKTSEVILRIAQEMNAPSSSFFEWCLDSSNNIQDNTHDTLSNFKTAWAHIHDRIRLANGCLGVGLFYCAWPSNQSTYSISQCFPGASVTQYIGVDIFSDADPASSGPWSTVPSLRTIINQPYTDLIALAGDLPIILGECGVVQTGQDDTDTETWFTGDDWHGDGLAGGIPYVVANKPQTLMLVYFNVIGTGKQFPDPPASPLTHAAMAEQVDNHHARVDPSYASDQRGPRVAFYAS